MPNSFDQIFRKIQVIWFAVASSLVLYGLAAVIVAKKVTPAGPEQIATLKTLFYFMGFAIFAGVLLLKSRLLPPPNSTPQTIQARWLVLMVLSESIAIFGLILGCRSGEIRDFVLLAALSLVAMTFLFPQTSTWQEWLKNAPQTPAP